MATWGEFAAEQPGLAASIRERFDVRKHKTPATLRTASWHPGRGVTVVERT